MRAAACSEVEEAWGRGRPALEGLDWTELGAGNRPDKRLLTQGEASLLCAPGPTAMAKALWQQMWPP